MLSFTLVFFFFRVFCYDYVKNRKRKKKQSTHMIHIICALKIKEMQTNVYCISASTKVNLHQQLSHERYKFTFGNNRKSSLKKKKISNRKTTRTFSVGCKIRREISFSSKQTKYSELTRFLVF